MKKLIILSLLLLVISSIFAQDVIETEEDNSAKFKNVKMLKSEQDETVQIK